MAKALLYRLGNDRRILLLVRYVQTDTLPPKRDHGLETRKKYSCFTQVTMCPQHEDAICSTQSSSGRGKRIKGHYEDIMGRVRRTGDQLEGLGVSDR
jgi:hypothetical protein